ncbi:MAG: penicillin acylase family protein [Acidimicrobiia bacterium]|nr:penicillin acylase family protein [Acidimicrobiia bacterium]
MSQTATEPRSSEQQRPRRSWWKTALWVLLALVIIALVTVALFLRFSVRRAFPQTSGTIAVAGLAGEVEVIRDAMGVPHIYADTVEDLFLAQGFVHAQDRFWQMDFWRHISHGRLSEMFGSSQLETDSFLRTLGFTDLAQRQYAAESTENQAILDAYAGGVNAYLETNSPSDLSFEYSVLELLNHSYEPEPWDGVDSLAWGKVMSWDLGGNMRAEIGRAMALASLTPERVDQIFPAYPGDRHPFILPDGSAPLALEAGVVTAPDAIAELAAVSRSVRAIDDVTGGGGEGIGSNSWALSGVNTPTGAPMLMDDPHLSIQMPSIWYQVGLHCRVVSAECPFDVAGFSFAGVPGVIIGHNADIAWGFTNTGPDVQDLYIEKVNPADPNQYEFEGAWLDMDVRTETVRVAGGEDVSLEIRSTIHGPIISEVFEPLEDFGSSGLDVPQQYAVALRWTALDDVPSIAGPILAINRAATFEEFREAARLFSVPAQNLLYADRAGNIGYQMPGNVPIRASGDGRYPVPGWTGEHEWTGFVPFDELPFSYNPPSGYIVTANNQVIDDSYPHLITKDWAYGYRAQRIVDLVGSNLGIGLDGHRTIQFDSYDLSAEYLRPFVLEAVRRGITEPDETQQAALAELTSWDLQHFAGSTGAAIWNATWRHILARTFHDELVEDLWPEGGSQWFEAVRGLAPIPDDPFWDDVTTPETEDRDTVLAAAFLEAVVALKDELGSDVSDWTWGDLHRATFRNGSLGDTGIGLIDDRFNRGPYPASGATSVVNAVGWDASEGYEVTWLPSMRMLVDLGDLRRSLAVHTTGQSGHIDHPHYDDMIPLWLSGENVPMLWDRSDIEANAEATLVLEPGE